MCILQSNSSSLTINEDEYMSQRNSNDIYSLLLLSDVLCEPGAEKVQLHFLSWWDSTTSKGSYPRLVHTRINIIKIIFSFLTK